MMRLSGVYQCDVCLAKNPVRLLPLAGHEKVLALKLIKSSRKFVLLLREPALACLSCFRKLYMFKLCIRSVLISRKLNGNMHSLSSSKDKKTSEPQPEESQTKEVCLQDYTCQCLSCQGKYGSLPLLLQVIEQKSREEKTEQEKRSQEAEPQPSTSSSQIQEADLRTKKVMVCQYCEKSFSHRGDYNKHLRTHTKEQPFECPVCKRKFAHTSNLQRHYRLHSGHRPFVCSNCDKTFSRKDKLECHMRSKYCRKGQNQSQSS